MKKERKTEQLQIRVSAEEKKAIRKAARAANTDMSSWILKRLFGSEKRKFQRLLQKLINAKNRSLVFAEINTFLHRLPVEIYEDVIADPLPENLASFEVAYITSMIELGCEQKKCKKPIWISKVKPLSSPYFGSDLENLRLYLLRCSPIPFRKRNIFIDASLGDQV